MLNLQKNQFQLIMQCDTATNKTWYPLFPNKYITDNNLIKMLLL